MQLQRLARLRQIEIVNFTPFGNQRPTAVFSSQHCNGYHAAYSQNSVENGREIIKRAGQKILFCVPESSFTDWERQKAYFDVSIATSGQVERTWTLRVDRSLIINWV